MTQIKNYYSFANLVTKKESNPSHKYQIVVKENNYEYLEDNDFKLFLSGSLDKLFIETLMDQIDATEFDDFLDYHLDSYRVNGGDEKSFVIHTQEVLAKFREIPIILPADKKLFRIGLIEEWLDAHKLTSSLESSSEKTEKLFHRQQILLLHSLGVFEIKEIKQLNAERKGILFGYLLNRDEKNTENYIRYIDHEEHKYSSKTERNKSKIRDILSNIELLSDSVKNKLS